MWVKLIKKIEKTHASSEFLKPTIFSSLRLFVLQGGSLANSYLALKRLLISDINEEMISESVISFYILVDIGSFALMEDLSFKLPNSPHKLNDNKSN